jgi:hypothetical protein
MTIKTKEYKCLNVINYIIQHDMIDKSSVLLTIYLADRSHLQMAYTTMYKEKYKKMNETIVPSTALEMLDNVRIYTCINENGDVIKVSDMINYASNGNLISVKDYDPNVFSDIDYMILDNIILFVKRNNKASLIDRIQKDMVYINTNNNEIVDFVLLVRSIDSEYCNSKDKSVEGFINENIRC